MCGNSKKKWWYMEIKFSQQDLVSLVQMFFLGDDDEKGGKTRQR